MSNFYFKTPDTKYDPKHPESTDATYARAVEKGRHNLATGKMKFENEAQERDYMKKCASNPGNIPGTPAFFPPLEIKSMLNGAKPAVECECGGCCIAIDNYVCPKCGRSNTPN